MRLRDQGFEFVAIRLRDLALAFPLKMFLPVVADPRGEVGISGGEIAESAIAAGETWFERFQEFFRAVPGDNDRDCFAFDRGVLELGQHLSILDENLVQRAVG